MDSNLMFFLLAAFTLLGIFAIIMTVLFIILKETADKVDRVAEE